jgi:hypothetical protein
VGLDSRGVPGPLREAWTDVLIQAHGALREDVEIGPNEVTESASWPRNGANVWEVRLALRSESALDPAERGLVFVGGRRIAGPDLKRAFGISLPGAAGRRPISTALRKAANFYAILCAVDELKADKDTYA